MGYDQRITGRVLKYALEERVERHSSYDPLILLQDECKNTILTL